MQSTPIPFAVIAALALCAIVATKAQAEGNFFFSKPAAADHKASHAFDDKRCSAVPADRRQGERPRTRS